MPHAPNKPCLRARLFWLGVIQLHWIAAIGVLYAMPRGFPVGHRHWWANEVFPWVVIAYAVVTTLAVYLMQWRAMVGFMLASPIALIGAAAAGLAMFPVSGRIAGLAVAIVATLALIGLRREFRPWWPGRRLMLAVIVFSIVFGAALPWTQRAEEPQTLPAGGDAVQLDRSNFERVLPTQAVTTQIRISPNSGDVVARFGTHSVQLSPLLTFESMSPDRCWTNLAPKAYRVAPRRVLVQPSAGEFAYLDLGRSRLRFNPVGDDGIELDATAELSRPVFSHLNSFCQATVTGHRKLSLIFSPAPDKPIDVQYSEYPTGRPGRMAYMDNSGVFHVVQATSGEKGPFHELAAGPLRRGEPLTITLLDEGKPFASMTLADFSSQASTQPSPTAGWGLPVNSIEFSLYDDNPRSLASIYISLASTSVGRGWDSVGHAAGVYRNRITLRPASGNETSTNNTNQHQ